MDVREENALRNKYAREAVKHLVGSPYRVNEYVTYRMKGMSEAEAIEKTRNH